jgi:hypothetical protein
MADFPSYQEKNRGGQILKAGLSLAALGSLFLPGVRRGAARVLLGVAERGGARLGGAARPFALSQTAAEVESLLGRRIPRAAQLSIAASRAEGILAENFGRSVAAEAAQARARQIVQTDSVSTLPDEQAARSPGAPPGRAGLCRVREPPDGDRWGDLPRHAPGSRAIAPDRRAADGSRPLPHPGRGDQRHLGAPGGHPHPGPPA